MDRIYLDNAATTAVSPEVLEAMLPYFTQCFGNPSSIHSTGRDARRVVDAARRQVAAAIGAQPQEIYFTAGGSESDNWAIKGTAFAKRAKGNHIITSQIEHHAVLHTCAWLEKQGFEVTYLPVDEFGRVRVEDVEKAITDKTILISIMAANNEIGTLQPITEIGKLAKSRGILFHTDAVQAVGHMKLDVKEMGIDMLSMASHKVRGPKGVGALYCRKGIILEPLIHGGGQERGLRSGTENVAGIVGFGEALRYAKENMDEYLPYVKSLTDHLIEEVTKIPYTQLTGDPVNRLPGTASFVIECIEGESLILLLDLNGIATSTGSACSTGSLDPSHVLMAIGLPHEIAHGSLRVTLGEQNTMEDVDYIIEKINAVVTRLRDMSPVWEEKMNGQPSLKLFDQ